MEPGKINLRGHPIQDLIGNVTFPQMIWLMIRGQLPSDEHAKLFECALVSAVDHGPQAPSIATARMAVTCGLDLNGAMASAVNMLDDVHGGAGEQAVELYGWAHDAMKDGVPITIAVSDAVERWRSERTKFIPGFGHRFHKPEDPRAPRLLALVDQAVEDSIVGGQYASIGRLIQKYLNDEKGRPVPMNIDGATAIIYAELGFAGPLARGLFCLSRSVGILSHAWEQMNQGGRNKGPTPPQYFWTYDGPDKPAE
ncbi:citryl-CoA lyase [Ahrensia sp. 13_GOM-1096m]|uniref:citryl-CoA lyase n=1 Tax=Ahrensia sp. 13_GOM-1096m TaxID=1380380 RepID=UPI001FFEE667